MNNTAVFYGISEELASKLDEARDAEAASFWAYPGADWQANFEADWLRQNGLPEAAARAGL